MNHENKNISLGELANKVGIVSRPVSISEVAEKVGYKQHPLLISGLAEAVEEYLSRTGIDDQDNARSPR
ncbi:hypothetical protein AAKU67_004391 [Oxalobacteraceae bacterium GrIS 2.11]